MRLVASSDGNRDDTLALRCTASLQADGLSVGRRRGLPAEVLGDSLLERIHGSGLAVHQT